MRIADSKLELETEVGAPEGVAIIGVAGRFSRCNQRDCIVECLARRKNVVDDRPLRPFVELTREQYGSERRFKRVLHQLGYYRVFGANAS